MKQLALVKSFVVILMFCGLTACTFYRSPDLVTESSSLPAGTLQLIPEEPRSGDSVKVRYRPIEALASEERLILRARFRTPEDPSYNHIMGSRQATELSRGPGGTFTGRFQLPPEVVFAAFVVEDPSASEIDANGGEFSELLVHDEQGRPLLEALEQRRKDFMGRDAREVLASARAMTEHYPELPKGWSSLQFAEGLVPGDTPAETRAESHRQRLRRLDRELRSAEVDADVAGAMYWYARGLDRSLQQAWLERLREIDSDHFFLVQNRVMALFEDESMSAEARLIELETMWDRIDDRLARERLAPSGAFAAREVGDGQVIERWARRAAEYSHGQLPDYSAIALAAHPQSREMGIDWLQSLIDELATVPEHGRPLGTSHDEYRRQLDTRIARLQTELGKALLAEDRPTDAVAALEAAAAADWSTERFEMLAEARRAVGDLDGAARAMAAVAADPMESRGSEKTALPDWLADYQPEWSGLVARAEAEMLEQTLARADNRPLNEVRLNNRSGERVVLKQLFGPEATVVVFWSRYCGPSSRAMPDIAALAQTLSGQDVPLLAVTDDPSGAALEFIEAQGLEVQVLFDELGEAKVAFNAWATPQYFVLDGDGRLPFAYTRLGDLMRQVVALKNASEVTA